MTDLLAEENDLALLDNHVRNVYFRRARLLIDHTKYDADDDEKPQWMITKIDILIHTQALPLTLQLIFLLQNRLHLKMNAIMIQVMLIYSLIELVMMKT